MDITHLTIEVRDKDLNRIGQIPMADLSLTIEDQFSNVGSWTLTLPSESPLAAILRQPGSGILVTLENGDVLMSGSTIKPEDAATSTDPNGTLTVDGLTDTVLLADRLCFPNPGNLDPAHQPLTHDKRTGTCEDLMFAYVNANIGPGAPNSADPNLGSRRDTRLQLGTNGHRGPVVTKRARFDILGNLLNELAATADLGFRIVQVGNKLEFQTFAVTDRSQSIRLDIRNNMLAGHKVATAPPSITRAIVAGQDISRDPGETGQEWRFERQFAAVSTAESRAGEAEWGRRIEVFVDKRQENGNSELIQAGKEALQNGGFSQISVQVVPMEDFFSSFGVDWHLGDHITVVVQGVEMQADITGYVLKYDSSGFRMGVTLGDTSALERGHARKVQSLDSRVSNLERGGVTPEGVAAVTVKYLSPTDFNQAALPATYPAGESLMYLNPTTASDGGWIDFASASGVIRTVSNGADVVQTWRRLHGSGNTPELWMRSGNLAQTWSLWKKVALADDVTAVSSSVTTLGGRVTTLETAPGTKIQTVSGVAESALIGSYPVGISHMNVGSGSGWSLNGGLGTVVTHQMSTFRAFQEFHASSDKSQMWKRGFYDTAWEPWQQVAMDGYDLTVHGAMTAGTWYRIAAFGDGIPTGSGPNRAAAEFILSDNESSRNNFIRFRASSAFSTSNSSLILEEYTSVGTPGAISAVRIVNRGGTGGAWVEVLCANSMAGMRMKVRHDDWFGGTRWAPVVASSTATVPSGGASVLVQRGFAPTGEFIAPATLNGWANWDPALFNAVGYRMRPGSVVELRGLVRSGTLSLSSTGRIFVLPPGYRPDLTKVFIPNTNATTVGRCDVNNAGEVFAGAGGNGYFSLEGITFTAMQ